MPVTPHRSLVQIFIILITLAVVFCFPQVDLRLEQTVGDNQLATGDFYPSNIDAPTPFLADIFQQPDIQKFLQWIHPPEPPKCDNGLSVFCCNWPAPNPNIGIGRPLHVDPEEVKKRRRKCGEWNKDRSGCLIPENNFCCDCKDVNDIAYNCYNPFYRDDARFQGKPEPKPRPLGHPIEHDRPAPREPELDENKEFFRDPQGGATEENDRIEKRAVVPSATNKIKSSTSTTSGTGGIGRTGADRQLPRAWKRAQPQADDDGDDPDGTGEDVELMRAWKRAQPAVPDGDDPDGSGEDVEIMRAWKRVQPAVPDGDDTERAGADAQLLRAWKRVQPAVPAVPNGDDTERAGADAQLLRAWKRVQPAVPDGDDTERAGADAQLLRAWKRVQPAVPAVPNGDDTERAGADAQLLRAWKRVQPAVPDGDDTERAGADDQLLRAWKRVQPAVPDGDNTERAGADAQLLRAWKRTTQPTTADSDDTARAGTNNAQQSIKRVWQRAQPEVSAADHNREKIVPNAQLLFAAWQRSQSWNGENAKGSVSSSSDIGEDGESEGADHYDDGSTTVRNPRDNDPAMCQKKYLENLGIFS